MFVTIVTAKIFVRSSITQQYDVQQQN